MQERLTAVSAFPRTPPQKLKRCVWHKAFAWILYNCTNIFSFKSAHPPRKGCLSANNRLWKVKNACETRNIYFKKVWSDMLACRAIPFLKCYAATQQIFWLFIICCRHEFPESGVIWALLKLLDVPRLYNLNKKALCHTHLSQTIWDKRCLGKCRNSQGVLSII